WGQRGAGRGPVDVVTQPVLGVDDAVVHVRRLRGVVEEEELAGVLVDLGVRRDALGWEAAAPGLAAKGLERPRIEAIEIAALVEARLGEAGMDDDVGARCVLHARSRAPAVPPPRPRPRFLPARPPRHA